MCWTPSHQVGGRTTSAATTAVLRTVERGIGNLARQQPLDELNLGGRIAGWVGQMPGQNRLAAQQLAPSMPDRRPSFGQSVGVRSPTTPSNCLDELWPPTRGWRRAASLLTASSNDRARRCHLVELVEEAVDRRGLLRRIGDEVAHQVACAMHGLGAEALPKLADQLLTQQLNLLRTLGFDAFQLGVCLGSQLLGDLLGVVRGLPRSPSPPRPWPPRAPSRAAVSASATFFAASALSSSCVRTVSCWSSSWCGPAARRISRAGRR